MRCASCGSTNPDGAKFCIECGAPLKKRCPACGVENLPQAKFCADCGTSLATTQGAQTTTPEVTEAATPVDVQRQEGERRQLTVMFCDLVGSTALSGELDPEEWRSVVRDYQAACAAVIRRFEGDIAQFLGDGLLVYFGYPQAHEDDVQRAVRAGLEIITALQNPLATGAREIQVRIGIHTGLVVVGEIGDSGKREQLALGETPNVAARLQGLAEPNTVVISAASHRLVVGSFDFRDLGSHSLKGLSVPLQVYQVTGKSGVRSRLEAANVSGLTPLVGREEEVAFLGRRWEQVMAGQGQVVLLSGEPGIGKSRLVRALTERLTGEAHVRIEWRCSPFDQNSAFHPVIEHLRQLLDFGRDDAPEERLGKLEGMLGQYGFTLPDVLPLFAVLLSLPLLERYPPLTLTPERQKQKTLEALVVWLRKEAQRQPALLIVEDLHWVDPSTLELLGLLIEQLATVPVALMLTFRPDFHPPWPMLSHLTHLTLSRLARPQVEAMVERISGENALSPEVLQQVIAKTDGVPLFVEELTKAILESGLHTGAHAGSARRSPEAGVGRASSPSLAIPTTLHDSLMARLDRLGTAKEVAQLGSTLGREFAYELIQAVSPVNEASLQQALARLVVAELLYQRGQPPQARYVFKHALIQDAAYQSLVKRKRQQYHQQIARAFEERLPETMDTQPELLAHHYTEAGLKEQALVYWQKAGERAVQRSANVEAISHLTKGLELLQTWSDTPDRARQELTLQVALGVPLRATKGFAAPEVGTVYSRALELCQQVGETPHLVPVLRGLWEFYELRAEYKAAYEFGGRLLTLAERVQDPGLLLVAHDVMGDTLFWLGEFPAARAHLDQGFGVYDVEQHRSHVFLYGYDSGVACLCFGAWALWFLGYPNQALHRVRAALTMARNVAHPFSVAFALQFAAQLHHYRREYPQTQELAAEVMTLSTEQGFPIWSAMATIVHGWALAEQGQKEEGIAQIRQGMVGWQAMGQELEWPHFLGVLAEAHGIANQSEEGLNLLAEALAVVDKTGEHFWEAELYRLLGGLSLQKGRLGAEGTDSPSPEQAFQKANEIARRQSAKSLELRAAMSLSRLWQQQGKKDEARRMLAAIHGWFTEGFDTPDLQEAKGLLEELS
jgi:class 3 adenylate cyclase/predicted ATPase